jgi:hypothetical protein
MERNSFLNYSQATNTMAEETRGAHVQNGDNNFGFNWYNLHLEAGTGISYSLKHTAVAASADKDKT